MWGTIASIGYNLLNADKEKQEQERQTKKLEATQHIAESRMLQQNARSAVDQNAMAMRGNTTQQQVLNDILNKYNVKL